MAEIQVGLRQKGWPRPTLLTRFFSSQFDLAVSAKTCRGFFRTEKCEAEEERPGIEALYFSVSQKTSKKPLREE